MRNRPSASGLALEADASPHHSLLFCSQIAQILPMSVVGPEAIDLYERLDRVVVVLDLDLGEILPMLLSP